MSLSEAEYRILENMFFKWGSKGCPPSKTQRPLTMNVPAWPLKPTFQDQILHEQCLRESMRQELIELELMRHESKVQDTINQEAMRQESMDLKQIALSLLLLSK